MPEIGIDAISTATARYTDYLPLAAFSEILAAGAQRVSESSGIPLEELMVVTPADAATVDGPDVCGRALAGLGAPPARQPLFLVRSGALRDAKVAELSRLVHESGWEGEDIGITHLDELGGTVVFDLLEWAVPEESGASVLVCDEPLFADARVGGALFTTVGLRMRRGPGPLTVLDCGEGPPRADGRAFTGARACQGWLTLHAALTAGEIAPGERLLLHTRGPRREGWLSLEATHPATLRLIDTDTESPAAGCAGAGR